MPSTNKRSKYGFTLAIVAATLIGFVLGLLADKVVSAGGLAPTATLTVDDGTGEYVVQFDNLVERNEDFYFAFQSSDVACKDGERLAIGEVQASSTGSGAGTRGRWRRTARTA